MNTPGNGILTNTITYIGFDHPIRKGREEGKRCFPDRGLNVKGRSVHPLPCVAEPVTSGPQPPAEQSRALLSEALHRQLQVELKVKQGAENMIHTCASGTPKVSAGV